LSSRRNCSASIRARHSPPSEISGHVACLADWMLKVKTTGDVLRADAAPVYFFDELIAEYKIILAQVRGVACDADRVRRLMRVRPAGQVWWGRARRALPQLRPPEPDLVNVVNDPVEFDLMFAGSIRTSGQHLE
jgi:glycyl-tRNA synthetase (class II)